MGHHRALFEGQILSHLLQQIVFDQRGNFESSLSIFHVNCKHPSYNSKLNDPLSQMLS